MGFGKENIKIALRIFKLKQIFYTKYFHKVTLISVNNFYYLRKLNEDNCAD